MNKELDQILIQVIIATVPIISAFLIRILNLKAEQIKLITNNKKIDKYIDLAKETIEKTVISVNQTYVDKFKQQKEFTQEKQQEAFKIAKNKILQILTQDTKKAILLLYTDIDTFIDTQIENAVNKAKKD